MKYNENLSGLNKADGWALNYFNFSETIDGTSLIITGCENSTIVGKNQMYCREKHIPELEFTKGNYCVCFEDYCNYKIPEPTDTSYIIWPIMVLVVFFVSVYVCMYLYLWHIKFVS